MDAEDVRILQQILAHSTAALSPEELAYRNAGLSETQIQDRLEELREDGYVTVVPAESDHAEMPSEYFRVTRTGMIWLHEHNLYEEISILYHADDALNRSDRIREIEQMDERPDVSEDVKTTHRSLRGGERLHD